MLEDDIKKDLERAEEALESAERNFKENDIFTSANRVFVACENSVYVLLKSKFGSSSVSRIRILTRLRDVSYEAKEAYDESYDLRVQADYGRQSKIMPLNKENLSKTLEKVRQIVGEARKIIDKY